MDRVVLTRAPLLAPCAILLLAVGIAAPAPAADPYGRAPSVTLHLRPSSIVFGQTVRITGRVLHRGRDVPLALQARPRGQAGYSTVIQSRTLRGGAYSFTVRPGLITSFRVLVLSRPIAQSPSATATVHLLVTLSSGRLRVRPGRLVSLSGAVYPAYDGRYAYLTQLRSRGRPRTIAHTRLLPLDGLRSTFRFRRRVHFSGVYRVTVAGDHQHGGGVSQRQVVLVR